MNEKFRNLPEVIEFKFNEIDYILKLSQRKNHSVIHQGKGDLQDIKWIQYDVFYKSSESNNLTVKYDNVALSFFRIDEEIYNATRNTILENGVSCVATNRDSISHLDGKSGNSHPDKKYVEKEIKNNKIRQFVLCKGLGPRSNILDNENPKCYYSYKCTHTVKNDTLVALSESNRRKERYVHRACYYPLIENIESLKQNWRYGFLTAFEEALKNKIGKEDFDKMFSLN